MNKQTAVEQQNPVEPPVDAEQRLKAERVQEELKAMAGWTMAREQNAIGCVRVFPTVEVAALYGAFVSRFASAAGLSATLSVAGGQVGVTLSAPQIGGCPGELTESVLAFARQI